MKQVLLLGAIFLLNAGCLHSQVVKVNNSDSFRKILGHYHNTYIPAEIFIIRQQDETLFLENPGKGKTSLTMLSQNRYRPDGVTPEATIEFVKDSVGKMIGFRWIQDIGSLEWNRVENDSSGTGRKRNDEFFTGIYRLQNKELIIKEEDGYITGRVIGQPEFKLYSVAGNRFVFKLGDLEQFYEFRKKESGKFQKVVLTRKGPIDFVKVHDDEGDALLLTRSSNRKNGFTHADSLRGMLTALRTCYDVLFYDIDVSLDITNRSIQGITTIRFKSVETFEKMQVDLYANMEIRRILFHNKELSYNREFNAVFVQFPEKLSEGIVEEIQIFYSGKPQVADPSTSTGGFLWYQDRNGKPWIESVCQGAGASLWWPCKDHLSDKPDSMKISVTVPRGLSDISNGKLIQRTELPGNQTRFDWYVTYPINNYNVVLNIGDYAHYNDLFITGKDTLALDYYCMPYNVQYSKQIFKNVKPMLSNYEKFFGQYPFKRDGFVLIESLYPMEHQTAVSIGPLTNPANGDRLDSAELIRLMWHESAHEWWGNSVTCSDMADLWIHEAFATYAEVLNYESFYSKGRAISYMKTGVPENKEPITGVYNVNDFHLGDMYTKGCLMLNTLRNLINNDSLWFNILKGIQERFRYQSIASKDIIEYINKITKHDYTSFFDQYLQYPSIPELSLILKKQSSSLRAQYKWNADVDKFAMPVKLTTAKDKFIFIYPTALWQEVILPNIKSKDIKVNTDDVYIKIKKE